MKKFMPLTVLALIVLFGCAKEEMTPAALSSNDQNLDESGVWIINTNSESPVWEFVTLDKLQSTQNSSSAVSTRSNGNSAHTHGNLTFSSISLSWSGTENNGGPHGSAYMEQTWAGGTQTAQMTVETECVRVDGSEAVYAGVITSIINPPPPPTPPPGCAPNCPAPPWTVGNHMVFKVIDNGQGNNAPPDQHCTLISIGGSPKCISVFDPGSSIWNPSPFNQILDVQTPGSVKVNN